PTLAAAYTLGLLAVLLGGLGGAALWQWRAAARGRGAARAAPGGAGAAPGGGRRGPGEAPAARDRRANPGAPHRGGGGGRQAPPAARGLPAGPRAAPRGGDWRSVHRLCHSDPLTFRGHAGPLTSASFSPDGSRVITASMDATTRGDGTAKIWDARTG